MNNTNQKESERKKTTSTLKRTKETFYERYKRTNEKGKIKKEARQRNKQTKKEHDKPICSKKIQTNKTQKQIHNARNKQSQEKNKKEGNLKHK